MAMRVLNYSTTIWSNTTPTASVFSLGNQGGGGTYRINGSGSTYIAYLFATVAGISKIGSYTGTGSDLNVDCGFSAGAKFVLIKRTDGTEGTSLWVGGMCMTLLEALWRVTIRINF